MTAGVQPSNARPTPTSRSWRRWIAPIGFPALALTALLLVWEGLVAAYDVPAYLVAPPSRVWASPSTLAVETSKVHAVLWMSAQRAGPTVCGARYGIRGP